MTFITPQDTNIIMDESRKIQPDQFKRFADAGATVALEFVQWSKVERKFGVRDWRKIDRVVQRVRDAGMKVILQGPTDIPPIFPDEWYCMTSDGRVMRDRDDRGTNGWACLSPWNEAARWYQYGFIDEMCKRYNSDDVLCIFAHSQEGESLLPAHMPCWFDAAAVASFEAWAGYGYTVADQETATFEWLWDTLSELVLDLQRIYLQNPHRELFMTLHPVFTLDPWRCSAVINVKAHLRNVLRHLAPAQLNWLIYSYFPGNLLNMRGYVEEIRNDLGVKLITGSEWVRGLRTNAVAACDAHIHALLTSPLHELSGDKTISQEAYTNIYYSRSHLLAGRNA